MIHKKNLHPEDQPRQAGEGEPGAACWVWATFLFLFLSILGEKIIQIFLFLIPPSLSNWSTTNIDQVSFYVNPDQTYLAQIRPIPQKVSTWSLTQKSAFIISLTKRFSILSPDLPIFRPACVSIFLQNMTIGDWNNSIWAQFQFRFGNVVV